MGPDFAASASEVSLSQLPLRPYSFSPSRTAMSTVASTPTCSSILMKVVFGEWARASSNVIVGLYEPAFSTQYLFAGQPSAPP